MTATSPSRVAVVTDSAASLPDDARVAGQVTVVPMTLTIGGTEYEDGSIAPAEVLRRTATESASTSAPSPGAFAAAIEQAGDADVLVITVASQMSSTYEAARMAADTLPSTRVQVLDSRTAAGGQGL
ncbi:MAG TPA: DegV family protein, partial [Acidimicrobiales bacterium]|nr:DegV family protein [Acidimicrobiales bacterium]